VNRLLASPLAGLPGPATQPILLLPLIPLVQQRASRRLAVHLGALKRLLLQILPEPPSPHGRAVHVRVVRRAQCKTLHVEGAHTGPGLRLKPASMVLESVSACRPPTSASVAPLRLDRCRGSTSGTHPAALTSPTRLCGYVDLECPPEDVGRYLSKRRVYPHAASRQGRSRGRPPRRRHDFYPYVGVVVLREGDISPRTPQVALGALLACIGKPAVCDVPDDQAMHVEAARSHARLTFNSVPVRAISSYDRTLFSPVERHRTRVITVELRMAYSLMVPPLYRWRVFCGVLSVKHQEELRLYNENAQPST